MIQCPNCKNSLPDWVQNCQFCGASTANVVRQVSSNPQLRTGTVLGGPSKWVWIAYFAIAIWFLVGGTIDGIRVVMAGVGSKSPEAVTFIAVLCIFPATRIFTGVGLLVRWEFVRKVVNFVCGIGILFDLLGIIGALLTIPITGGFGVLLLCYSIFDLSTDAGMIYLIGETDGFEPRFT